MSAFEFKKIASRPKPTGGSRFEKVKTCKGGEDLSRKPIKSKAPAHPIGNLFHFIGGEGGGFMRISGRFPVVFFV